MLMTMTKNGNLACVYCM